MTTKRIDATATPEKLAKLPRWAQDEIHRLNMRLAEAIEMRDDALGQVKNPGPFVVPGYSFTPDVPISGSRVRLRLSDDPRGFPRYIEVSLVDGNEVRVYAHGGVLVVTPRASNAIVLDVDYDR